MRTSSFVALALLSWVASAAPAYADLVPREEGACIRARIGDLCRLPRDRDHIRRGTCQKSTCERRDYENWNEYASPAPPMKAYECLVCVAANVPGTDGGQPKDGGDRASSTGGRPQTDAGDRASSTDGGPQSKGDGGCNLVGSTGSRSTFTALALAAAVGLLVSRRRTR